jgi:hypothetical protein
VSELVLSFAKSQGTLQLERTVYVDSSGLEVVTVRGKTSGAYRNAGAFQWTPGVKALAVSFLRALANHLKKVRTYLPLLEGERGSLAASLNYALYKQPAWLFDMFGMDDLGNARLRSLLFHSNLGTGKIAISLNEDLLPAGSIRVYVGAVEIRDADELGQLAREIISEENSAIVPDQKVSWALSGIPIAFSSNERQPHAIALSLSEPDNIYLFEQLQYPSQTTADRIGLKFSLSESVPPAVFGRVVQARHLFEELTYQTCDATTRGQFEQWVAGMTAEQDAEWGLDREKDGVIIPGFLRWIKEQNMLFDPNGFYRTFIWRDRLTGEMVATATIGPDDRGISARYDLQGDGHIGGINVRWDLRFRGLGKYISARLNQYILEFVKREHKAKLLHTYNYDFRGVPSPFLQAIGYDQHPIGPVRTDFGLLPLWSKKYSIDEKMDCSRIVLSG